MVKQTRDAADLVAEFAEATAAQTDAVWRGDARTGIRRAVRMFGIDTNRFPIRGHNGRMHACSPNDLNGRAMLLLAAASGYSLVAASGCSIIIDTGAYERADDQADAASLDARPGSADARPDPGSALSCLSSDAGAPVCFASPKAIPTCYYETGSLVDSDVQRLESTAAETVHLAAVYGVATGEAEVFFALPGQNVLVLSAYEPVVWNVRLAPGACLSRIILIGQSMPEAGEMPDGVSIDTYQMPGRLGCGVDFRATNDVECSMSDHLDFIRNMTGHEVDIFESCFQSGAITFSNTSEPMCQL